MIDRVLAEGVAAFDPMALESTPGEVKQLIRQAIEARLVERGESPTPRQIEALTRRGLGEPSARPRATTVFDVASLQGIPVIAGDDVGEYCARLPDGTRIDDAVATLAPPFDRFWIEFQRVPNPWGLHSWAVLVVADADPPDDTPLPDDDVPRWLLNLHVFVELEKRAAMGPVAIFQAGLGDDGTWLRHADGEVWWGGGPPPMTHEMPTEEMRAWGDRCVPLVFPALMTISFMHCTNVAIRSVSPSPKVSKKHEKRTGRPWVRYHTLDIEPMRKVLNSYMSSSKTGLRGALHIARGHFKVFTEDAPLFGRHIGTYWWSSQVRGSHDEGVVLKDYRVGIDGLAGRTYVTASEEPGDPPSPSITDPDVVGRGRSAHGQTQNQVARAVTRLGYRPRSPGRGEPLYDIAWQAGETFWVCEVKSLTASNEERQMQRAIGQVIRYRQKMAAQGWDVQAVIVAEFQPSDPSWDDLCRHEDIVLAWPAVLEQRLG